MKIKFIQFKNLFPSSFFTLHNILHFLILQAKLRYMILSIDHEVRMTRCQLQSEENLAIKVSNFSTDLI